ncbi:MAG: hypothetical protein IJW97_08680 [Clostridia bacterium]|nr:hypothetical protein [Clostridia bacterium]
MKRFTLLLLAMLLVLLAVACADTPADDDLPPADESENGTGKDPADEEEPRIEPDLPNEYYNNAPFSVIHWAVNGDVGGGWTPWEEISVESMTGDHLENEVYQRNAAVEEKYGVTITNSYFHTDSELPGKIRNAVNTGDTDFQMMVQRSNTLSGMWLENLFYDLGDDDLPYIDLSMPWWNASSVENFTFGDKTQFASSEMLLLDKGATACVYFNTKVATDNGITDLYEIVRDQEWTWEVLAEYAEDVTRELDGDDEWSAGDLYGALGAIDVVAYLYGGSGHSIGHIEDDRYFVHEFAEEENIQVMSDLYDYMYHVDYRWSETPINKFKADEGLFMYGMVKTSASLRDMETNYGILPIPKYNEEQENYSSLVWQHYDSVIGVPTSCGDSMMVSVIIEALSAESYYTVYPMFHDTVLMGKSTRDQESKEMLQIVFDTRKYDIGMIYDPTTFAWKLWTEVDSNTLASHCAAFEASIEEKSRDFNDMVDSWD